jgi:hypothetical protein
VFRVVRDEKDENSKGGPSEKWAVWGLSVENM